MNFQETVEKCGFDLAVVLFYGRLDADTLNSFSFEQWKHVYGVSSEGSELKKVAMEKIIVAVQSLTQWKEVYVASLSEKNGELEKLARAKLSECLPSFCQWLKFYKAESKNSDLQVLALEKLCELALTFKQWVKVEETIPMYSENNKTKKLKETAAQKLGELAKTFNQNNFIFLKFRNTFTRDSDTELEIGAREKMIKLATTFEQWNIIGNLYCADKNKEFRTLAVEKMSNLATTFEQWKNVYSLIPFIGNEFGNVALKKLSEFTQSFEEWEQIYNEYCQNRSGWEENAIVLLARKKMGEFSRIFEKWEETYGGINQIGGTRNWHDDYCLKKLVLEKMGDTAQTIEQHIKVLKWLGKDFSCSCEKQTSNVLKIVADLAKTFEQWECVYKLSPHYEKGVSVLAVKKMGELAETLDQWKKVYNLYEADYKLRKLAGEKISEHIETFEQWHSLYVGDDRSNLSCLREKKIVELAQVFDQCWQVYRNASRDSSLQGQALEKMVEKAKFLDQLLLAYKIAPCDSRLEKIALDKLLQLKLSFSQCQEICLAEVYPDSKKKILKDKVLIRICELAQSFDDWLFLYQTALRDSDLQKMALEKMKVFTN